MHHGKQPLNIPHVLKHRDVQVMKKTQVHHESFSHASQLKCKRSRNSASTPGLWNDDRGHGPSSGESKIAGV